MKGTKNFLPEIDAIVNKFDFGWQNCYRKNYWMRRKANIILNEVNKSPSKKDKVLIDFGSENCLFSIILAKYFKEVIAVDAMKKYLDNGKKIAKKLGVKNIKFVHCLVEDFSYNKKVDIVLCHGLLHFVPKKNVKKAIKNITSFGDTLIVENSVNFIHKIYYWKIKKQSEENKVKDSYRFYDRQTVFGEYLPTAFEFIRSFRKCTKLKIVKIIATSKPIFMRLKWVEQSKVLHWLNDVTADKFPFYLCASDLLLVLKRR